MRRGCIGFGAFHQIKISIYYIIFGFTGVLHTDFDTRLTMLFFSFFSFVFFSFVFIPHFAKHTADTVRILEGTCLNKNLQNVRYNWNSLELERHFTKATADHVSFCLKSKTPHTKIIFGMYGKKTQQRTHTHTHKMAHTYTQNRLPQFDLFYSSTLYGPYFVQNSC